MKRREKGFTLIELLVVIAITAIAAVTATIVIFQVFRNTNINNDRMTVARDVQNAGYWISRDAQMAVSMTTNLTGDDFLFIDWTEWDTDGNETYHSAGYSFEGLTNNVGKLIRTHWSSAGASDNTVIAQYLYYEPSNVDNTTKATYQSSVLTLQVTAVIGDIRETREYQVKRRPNF
ncbi:MAG: prepilin-type N-terminal cleavage/methylation domain-containing protein [Chloroflexota bacterium]